MFGAKAKRHVEKIRGRDKSWLTGKAWAKDPPSTGDCVGPALDPEQLTVRFWTILIVSLWWSSSSVWESGWEVFPPLPLDLVKGDKLGFFASTFILSINSSSFKVTWVSLYSLDQGCQTVQCQWAPFWFLEGTRQQRSWTDTLQSSLPWPPGWKQ